jgi:hypothetical protein
VAAFGLAALTPATRPLLNDQRIAGLDRRQLAYQVLLRIPVGTVAWEEIAFRGVTPGGGRRGSRRPGRRHRQLPAWRAADPRLRTRPTPGRMAGWTLDCATGFTS